MSQVSVNAPKPRKLGCDRLGADGLVGDPFALRGEGIHIFGEATRA